MSSSKSRAKNRQKQKTRKNAQSQPSVAASLPVSLPLEVVARPNAPGDVPPAASTVEAPVGVPPATPQHEAATKEGAFPVAREASPVAGKATSANKLRFVPREASAQSHPAATKEAETPAPAPPSDRFWMSALLILVISIVLRQVQLGQAPFYPDENIHTFFAQGFSGYSYNPTFHGPLLYHLVAGVFSAFGQYDYTARLVPSLLGIGLIALVLGPARVWMGERASLAAAALLAVSPSVVTYSRHLLHDALALDLTLGAVLCFVTALHFPAGQKRGRWALLGLAACLSLFLATKANFFFLVVVIAAFWASWWARGRVRLTFPLARLWPAALFGLVTLAAIAFPRDNTFAPPLQDFQQRVFQIVSVVGCALFLVWTTTRPDHPDESAGRARWKGRGDWAAWVLALALGVWIYVFLFGQGAQIIERWATTRAFPQAAFVAGQASARGAISKMLDYWGGQQAHPRLPGRHDYYVVLGLLYEIPILVAAMGGIWHATKNRGAWSDFLLWWAFASWTVYALANEKVPWLWVHLALPLALLGALWIASLDWKRPLFFAATFAGLAFCLRSDAAMIFERAGDHAEPLLYAQTPDAFRDAVQNALAQTRGDTRPVWLNNDRQWPSFWYLREQGNPPIGSSKVVLGGAFEPDKYRAFVANEGDLTKWTNRQGWRLQTVDFLIWPRASWGALQPARFWRWFWTRRTIERGEYDSSPAKSSTSILAGQGEWSYQSTVVGSRVER